MSQVKIISSKEKLARNVRYYREKAGLTREAVSLELKLDNSYISKLERLRLNPTLDKLDLIAQYFSIEVKDLFV